MASFAYINVGQFPNDQTGDTLRTAFQKVNQNNANLAFISNVLTNVVVISSLANANIMAVPDSLVIRDANANGFFANVTANGVVNVQVLSIDGKYELPTTSGLTGQVLQTFSNGLTYWGNVSAGTAPGSNTEVIFNSAGVFAAAANITTDGSNLVVNGTISAGGGIVYGPLSRLTANSSPLTINLATNVNQFITVTANVGMGNVTTTHSIDGYRYTFVIQQDTTGGWTWNWPSSFLGGGNISLSNFNASANSFSSQTFLYNGNTSLFYAVSSLITVAA